MEPTLTSPITEAALYASEGYFGPHGGCHVPEVLRANMHEVATGFTKLKDDEAFGTELAEAYRTFAGRPTPLTHLARLSDQQGGAQLYLKNEGLLHTGAHKLNHALGQILLAKHLGKQRIIAETGAGQHGYATATVCARYGMPLTVYMGRKDYERQRSNVYWMELLGAEVIPVESGSQTLNDAVIAAFQDLIRHPDDSYYLLGSAVGPHPYPVMNAYFQRVIGAEARSQMLEQTGSLPTKVLACVGGGSNALGIFLPFVEYETVQLLGVEAGGTGTNLGQHAAKMQGGTPGIFEGYASYFLQDHDGNIAGTRSICAGLDYCGISPLLAHLYDQGRVQFASAKDDDVLQAVKTLAQAEGIILALESAHALAEAIRLAPTLPTDEVLLIGGSGRGEKDLFITMPRLQPEAYKAFITNEFNKHG